jgi:hypothetical protein
MKKLLHLYNIDHNPFPTLGKGGLGYHLGKGGLGYHLPQYMKTIHGDGLEFVGDELIFVPDKNMTVDELINANANLRESTKEANVRVPQYSNDERDTKGFEFIDTPENERRNELEALKAEADIILNAEGKDTNKYEIDLDKVEKNEELFLKDVLGHESEYQSKMTDELMDDISLISRKKNKGYGLALEDYLVNPENIHVLKDPSIKFTSSVSDEHPILNNITYIGKPLKDYIVFDLFSDSTIYEIKNFGMSTRGYNAKSYDEIKNSDDPFIDIQCTKIHGNPSFKPRYILYNDGTFKVYNIECTTNKSFILPETNVGFNLKYIVMLKDGIYEYNPLDDDYDFKPMLNTKGHGKYLKNDKGEKIGQIYEPNSIQPFKKIFKRNQEHYKLDINKFNKIKIFKQ